MPLAKRFEGSLSGAGLRVAIVTSKFRWEITERLLEGARDVLRERGVAEGDCAEALVPGAFELPLAAQRLAETKRYDAVICLGAVIRGETSHDAYISGETAAGLQRVALDTGIPCVFGVITPNTMDQALDRAGRKTHKGREAAETAVEMATLLRAIDDG